MQAQCLLESVLHESRQRHTHLRLQQVELASFTLRDGRLVTFDRISENLAQLWDDVQIVSLFVGSISLVVGYTLVVSLYIYFVV